MSDAPRNHGGLGHDPTMPPVTAPLTADGPTVYVVQDANRTIMFLFSSSPAADAYVAWYNQRLGERAPAGARAKNMGPKQVATFDLRKVE